VFCQTCVHMHDLNLSAPKFEQWLNILQHGLFRGSFSAEALRERTSCLQRTSRRGGYPMH